MFCQNCVEQLTQQNKATQKAEKSKNAVIIIVSAFLIFSMIVVAIASVIVISFFSYRCYDCRKSLVFEKHVGCFVCEECHDRWMAEEYGITKG